MSLKIVASTMSSVSRPRIFILDFLQFYMIKSIFLKQNVLVFFLLYVREIWALIDIFKCLNVSFKIVASAVS